jgi:ketosteroid isomerase-like protein
MVSTSLPASADDMPKKRAALMDSFYNAFRRGDVAALLELCHDDVEVYKAPGVVDMVAALTPRGRDRVAGYLQGWLDSWDAYEPMLQEVRSSGDQVVALVKVHSRGRGSQFDLNEDMADVFTVRDDKISSMRLYVTRDDALGAVAE